MAKRTPEQKAASAAKAKETRARNKKVKSAVTAVESKSVVGKVPLTAQPHLTSTNTPLATPIRGSKDIEKEAKRRKTEYEGIQSRKAEREARGYVPTSEATFVGPTTTSEGLPIGRTPGSTRTRGHMSAQDHVRQLEASATMLGVSTRVGRDVRGEIRGLSKDSPVVPPMPTMSKNKETGEVRQVLYTHRADKSAPVYTGTPNFADAERWGTQGRPDLLDVVQQHQQIATGGGINRGPTDKVDTRPGSRGEFSGLNPEALETAVKREVLPDRINRAVEGLMRPGNVSRARQVPRPRGLVGGGMTPAQQERTQQVRVTEGGRTTNMTQEQHQERAEKRIAKRNKAEGES